MHLRTRKGSKAFVYKSTETHYIGAYESGGELFPCRWERSGYYNPDEKPSSLDLMYGKEEEFIEPPSS